MDKDISLLAPHEGGNDVLIDNHGGSGEAQDEGHQEEEGELHGEEEKKRKRRRGKK